MVTLYRVIDKRTGNYYSVAIIKEKNVKWFVDAAEAEDEADE